MSKIIPSPKAGRYSIGEWYGQGIEVLSPQTRHDWAKAENKADAQAVHPCPFKTNTHCFKKGGVCSLRLYVQDKAGVVQGEGPIITTCPQRFLENQTVFKWVGETILGTSAPIVLGEIGFLERLTPDSSAGVKETEGHDIIGRIDNVLLHPQKEPLEWCALEMQAVYFSGDRMDREFRLLSQAAHPQLPFPAGHRRPDWRSSGPKRLLPQLQTKVPTISRWGKKMAVVVDEAFFGSLTGLETDQEKDLSNAEIAWFVVGYDACSKGWQLSPRKVVLTRLDASVKALTGGKPMSKSDFEKQLRQKLASVQPDHPLTRGG